MDNFNFCIGIVDLHERSDDDYYKVDVIFDDDECESRLKNFDTSVNPDTYNFENLPMIFDVCYSAIRSTNISLRIKAFDCILTFGYEQQNIFSDYITNLQNSNDYPVLQRQAKCIISDLLMIMYGSLQIMMRLEESHKEMYSNTSVNKKGNNEKIDRYMLDIKDLRIKFVQYITDLFKYISEEPRFLNIIEESGFLTHICETTVNVLVKFIDHKRFHYKDEKEDLVKIFIPFAYIIKCLNSSEIVGTGLSDMFENSQRFCSFTNFYFIDALCDVEEYFSLPEHFFEDVYGKIIDVFVEKAPTDSLKEGSSKVFISSLKSLTQRKPKFILRHFPKLATVLFSECGYTNKNCVLSILGQLVVDWSNFNNSEDLEIRRYFVEKILSFEDDKSSLIRAKCLSILKEIIEKRVLDDSLSDIGILKILNNSLVDEQTSVRKIGLQALKELIANNPYSETLSYDFINKQYKKAYSDLEKVNSSNFTLDKDAIFNDINNIFVYYNKTKDISKYKDVPIDYLPSLLDNTERINFCASYIKQYVDYQNSFNVEEISNSIFNYIQNLLENSEDDCETDLLTEQCLDNIVKLYKKLSFIRQMEDCLDKVLKIAFNGSVYEVREALSLLTLFKKFGIDNSILTFRKICRLAFRKNEDLQQEVFKCIACVCISEHEDTETRYKSTLQNVMELLIGDEEHQPGVEEAIAKLIICIDTKDFLKKKEFMDKKMFELLYNKYIDSEESDSTKRLAAIRLVKILSLSRPNLVKEKLENLKVLLMNEMNPIQFHVEILEIIYQFGRNNCDLIDKNSFLFHFDDDLIKFLFSELQKNLDNPNYTLWLSVMHKFVAIIFDACYESTFIISEFFQVCLKKLEFLLKIQINLEQLHDNLIESFRKGDDLTMTTALKHKINRTRKFVCYKNRKVDLVAIRLSEFIAEVGLRFTVYNDKTFVHTSASILDTLKKIKKGDNKLTKKIEIFNGDMKNLTLWEKQILNNEGIFFTNESTEAQDEAFDQGLPSEEHFKSIAVKNANNEAFLEGRILERMMQITIFICLSEKSKKDGEDSINCFSKEAVNSAYTALSKLALVNDTICSRIIEILFNRLYKVESHTKINLLITITDLLIRFPNNVEPFSDHFIQTVLDSDIRESITHVARRLLDKDDTICSIAQYFFQELMKEDKDAIKIIPELISELIFRRQDILFEEYQSIVYFVLSLIEKDSISDYLINNFCDRLKSNTSGDEIQRIETAKRLIYAISLLEITEKSFKYISMAFPHFSSLILSEQEICDFFKIIVEDIEKLCIKTNNEDNNEMYTKFITFANRVIDGSIDNVAENEEQQKEYYKEIVEKNKKTNKIKKSVLSHVQ
ncbi:Condensin complex subunit 1 [Strongyloides ratti]|uniref:Condensin complex subunit 1 n=1 Tax=Strongyloides ratti TaxID=34506 RepID=A0A090MY25_STRRB|nr:Condensin complex subunit 1 [Strongyloides ratti]CEF66444.1 Condensin complex subunit 1 [Strongyloides ratti]